MMRNLPITWLGGDATRTSTSVRQGAVRASEWLCLEAFLLADAGKSISEVTARLQHLKEVLCDWQDQVVENLPEGAPWDWKKDDLEDYVQRRKQEW